MWLLIDRGLEGDVVDRVRMAWLRLLDAHVRAAEKHAGAAAVHARWGHPERAAVALDRLVAERAEFNEALALHPEWAADAPRWPEFEKREWDG